MKKTGIFLLSLFLILVTIQPANAKDLPIGRNDTNGLRPIQPAEDRSEPDTRPSDKCNTHPQTFPLEMTALTLAEQMDNFFLNTPQSGQVEVWVTKEGESDSEKIGSVRQGSVIKVHAKFSSSSPEGTYIFYIRPDTGAYENAMIAKGRLSGMNQITGQYFSFYIPMTGQTPGEAKVYVYIPGHGIGSTSIDILGPNQE